jgi:hypothetical protein
MQQSQSSRSRHETIMALKRSTAPSGRLLVLEHTSAILRDNPLGDPHVRKLAVWLPPQYDDRASKRRFPVLYDLVGFTGSGLSHTAWKPFGDNVPERAARLIHERKMGPRSSSFPTASPPSAATSTSTPRRSATTPTTSRARSSLRRPRVPHAREPRASRLLRQVLRRLRRDRPRHEIPAYWGAIANHSGDAYFDFVYWHDWPNTLNELAKHRRAEAPARALRRCREAAREGAGRRPRRRAHRALPRAGVEKEKLSRRGPLPDEPVHGRHLRSRPEGALGFRVPFNLESGEADTAALATLAAHDPVNLVARTRAPQSCAASTSTAAGATSTTSTTAARILSKRLERCRHRAHLRRVRRQPFRHRLPDGRQPAVSLSRAAQAANFANWTAVRGRFVSQTMPPTAAVCSTV